MFKRPLYSRWPLRFFNGTAAGLFLWPVFRRPDWGVGRDFGPAGGGAGEKASAVNSGPETGPPL